MKQNNIKDNTQKRSKWHNSYIFPLIPILSTRKRDEHSANGFTFQWLFIKVWSLEHIEFEIAVNISTHWGIGITAIVPYLRIVLCIPCPEILTMKIDKIFSRSPKDNG